MTYVVPLTVALLGHGAVAAEHVRAFRLAGASVVAAYGRSAGRARAFADTHRIPGSGDEAQALEAADLVVICSPSDEHARQARAALMAGRNVLVELPAAADASEAAMLAHTATKVGARLFAAHTSRYLPAIRTIDTLLRAGTVGAPRSVTLVRHVVDRTRSWTDDALLHHGQHAVDIVRTWFGDPSRVVDAESAWRHGSRTSAGVTLSLRDGLPVRFDVVHGAPSPIERIVIEGSAGRIESDGFGQVRVHTFSPVSSRVCLDQPQDVAYARAIELQDEDVVRALRHESGPPAWSETEANLALLDRIARIERRRQ